MKTFTKVICLLLVVATLCSMSVSAAAAEEAGTYSRFFISYGGYCHKVTDTQFRVWFDVVAQDYMDVLGAEKIKIQKSSDGENWLTVMTYNSSYYTHLLTQNDYIHDGYVTYNGALGYYYRAYVVIYAENSTGNGKVYFYTQPIYLGS